MSTDWHEGHGPRDSHRCPGASDNHYSHGANVNHCSHGWAMVVTIGIVATSLTTDNLVSPLVRASTVRALLGIIV